MVNWLIVVKAVVLVSLPSLLLLYSVWSRDHQQGLAQGAVRVCLVHQFVPVFKCACSMQAAAHPHDQCMNMFT